MDLDMLRMQVFVAVLDHNGYSAAARHLHLSQPTVSHHVSELEKGLGVELLRYENRTINLTEAGQEVYRVAVVMLGEQDRLGKVLEDLKLGRTGRVRVGASIAFEQGYFLNQVVAPFYRKHQGTLLSLRFGHSRSQAQAVLDQALDLAYVIRWHLPRRVRFELLHSAVLTFLASPAHPLAEKETVEIAEIARAGLITAPLTNVESGYDNQVLRECGLSPDDSVLEIDGMQARVLATEAGLGVMATFIPPYAREEIAGSLVSLPVEGTLPEVEVGFVRHPGDPWSASVDSFADWLRKVTSA